MTETLNSPITNHSRILWVDILKGICIIFIVMGHSGAPFITYLYLFHIAAFLFLSGYTCHSEKYRLFPYIFHKCKTLLFPMLIINSIYILFYVALQKLGLYHYLQAGAPMGLFDRFKLLFLYAGTPDFGGATWFLLVLFTIEILYKLISLLCTRLHCEKLAVWLIALLSLAGWYCIRRQIILPYLFDLSLFGCLFFASGMITSRHHLLEKFDPKAMIPLCVLLTVFFGSFYFAGTLSMNWPTRLFASSLSIQLISCFSALYLCILLAKLLAYSKPFSRALSDVGKRTYCILTTHFVMFRLLFFGLVLLKIFPTCYLLKPVPKASPYPLWLFFTAAAVGLCLLLSHLSSKSRVLNYIVNAKWPQKKEENKNDKSR